MSAARLLALALAAASLLGGCARDRRGWCRFATVLQLSEEDFARVRAARAAAGGALTDDACEDTCRDIATRQGVRLPTPTTSCDLGPGDGGFALSCGFQLWCGPGRPPLG